MSGERGKVRGGKIVRGERREGRGVARCALVLAAFFSLSPLVAAAQSTGPRDLAELKQETQRRADRNLPPLGGVKSEDVREAMEE